MTEQTGAGEPTPATAAQPGPPTRAHAAGRSRDLSAWAPSAARAGPLSQESARRQRSSRSIRNPSGRWDCGVMDPGEQDDIM